MAHRVRRCRPAMTTMRVRRAYPTSHRTMIPMPISGPTAVRNSEAARCVRVGEVFPPHRPVLSYRILDQDPLRIPVWRPHLPISCARSEDRYRGRTIQSASDRTKCNTYLKDPVRGYSKLKWGPRRAIRWRYLAKSTIRFGLPLFPNLAPRTGHGSTLRRRSQRMRSPLMRGWTALQWGVAWPRSPQVQRIGHR